MSTQENPTNWQKWVMAIRPKTLPAAAAPVIVGVALAFAVGQFKFGPAAACLVAALLLQIGSNLANDVFDYEKGADAGDRLGPTRVTQSGLLTPDQVKNGMVIVFGITIMIGLYLIIIGGWGILVLGVTAILSAIAYTGGPYPLGYHGLGDLFVFIFFGLAATAGTYYLQVGSITTTVLALAVALGFLTVNILVVNNLRDIENDRKVAKKTLAVRLGARGAIIEYYLLVIGAYLIPIGLVIGQLLSLWGLLVWISFPLALKWARFIRGNNGRALNQALAGTGQVELVYALLFSLGMIISTI
jgi:1,4-dihydroxy-2-naphthoate polyprenyltransferase